MKITSMLTAGALIASLANQAIADNAVVAAGNASAPDQQAIEKIVHDYLINNPEVLLEASQVLQKKQQMAMQKEAKSAIAENASQLLNENLSVAGNPKGKVTLIEFFDYQCGHCKTMKPVVSELIKKDPNLRVIYKEFPIFGKSSELASRVALAAALQGKYEQVQEGLFKSDKHLDQESIMNIAKAAGVNMAKLKVDMQSKAVTDALANNQKLAEKMRLMGTPAFIVLATPDGQFKSNSEPGFVPGASTTEALQALINKAV